MKYMFILIVTLTAVFILFFKPSHSPLVVLHKQEKHALPRNFRSLDFLQISGSGQFSEKGLRKMCEVIPSNSIIIVDMRQESHGFVNGQAISWYANKGWSNVGKTENEVGRDEQQRLDRLRQTRFLIAYVNKVDPILLAAKTAITEQELTKSLGLGYQRFAVTDHCRPSDTTVDAFVTFVKTLPKKTWLHFHCSAGKGRTTTFMAMYAMMHTSRKIGFEEIMHRQTEIGGMDLLSLPDPSLWKYPHAVARAAFIKHFYTYCQENPDFETSWSSWLAQNPLLAYP